GQQTAVSPTAPATPINQIHLGHRASLATGQGYHGAIGEVLYVDRTLTEGQLVALERHLSAKWGIPITPQRVWYVDTVGGDDTNSGRTLGHALKTITQAWQGIAAQKASGATILLHAPQSAPARVPAGPGLVKSDGGSVRIAPALAGDSWHLRGAVEVRGGWTANGGGVYSRPLDAGPVTAPIAIVPTLLDSEGQPTRILTRNTATPTTPAAGEFGFTSGTYYVHLPGDVNPNLHTVEIVVVQSLLTAHSGSTILLDRGELRGGQNAVVLAGSNAAGQSGGAVEAVDCTAELALVGAFATAGGVTSLRAVRCIGQWTNNDGFNHSPAVGNAAVMELVECIGRYNADEGVSPHNNAVLILRDGRYHHNGSGGVTSVGSAVVQIAGTEVDHNRTRYSGSGWDIGGVAILEQSSLVSLDLYSHDHPGPGIEVDTAGGATWTDRGGTRSGTEHGNGAPDAV